MRHAIARRLLTVTIAACACGAGVAWAGHHDGYPPVASPAGYPAAPYPQPRYPQPAAEPARYPSAGYPQRGYPQPAPSPRAAPQPAYPAPREAQPYQQPEPSAYPGYGDPRREAGLPASVQRIQSQTGGQVLRAQPYERNGREVYRVKVLTPQGRIRVYEEDPNAGRGAPPGQPAPGYERAPQSPPPQRNPHPGD